MKSIHKHTELKRNPQREMKGVFVVLCTAGGSGGA